MMEIKQYSTGTNPPLIGSIMRFIALLIVQCYTHHALKINHDFQPTARGLSPATILLLKRITNIVLF
jgi:hypothetical protein